MVPPKNQRTFERVPFSQKIKVMSMGRMVAYTMAINLGMGGVLLKAANPLPIGRKLRLDIPATGFGGGGRIVAEGTVIRSDPAGMAVQFLNPLEPAGFEALLGQVAGLPAHPVLAAYQAYFQVSRSPELADCEKLLGVSRQTFRRTFYATFSSCIGVSILGVWLFQGSIPPYPNWVKVALSFLYGAVWLALIQPSLDLAVFHFLRHRHAHRTTL